MESVSAAEEAQGAEFTSGLRSMETNHKPMLMLRCKVVIVGDACVGKTALVQVNDSGNYPKSYMMTSWVDMTIKQVAVPDTNAGVELFLFDCAGQTVFNQVESNVMQYENASYVMVVYDIGNRASFDHVQTWLQKVKSQRPPNAPPLPGVLVANKIDLRSDEPDAPTVVTTEEGATLAKNEGLDFFETSAAQQKDVDMPFFFIADQFHKKYQETVKRSEQLSATM
mmetsp:Transcript_17552/g.32019  ORF Transcript_17552/g.32019 Transcript_17552/m.32019 type:complete len:225 (-) Transcript_17552:118-792(-)